MLKTPSACEEESSAIMFLGIGIVVGLVIGVFVGVVGTLNNIYYDSPPRDGIPARITLEDQRTCGSYRVAHVWVSERGHQPKKTRLVVCDIPEGLVVRQVLQD